MRICSFECSSVECAENLFFEKFIKGKAAEIIIDFPLSDAAYLEVWFALVARFDNKNSYSHIIRRFFYSPRDEGWLLIDSVNRILRGLKIAGENPENWSI